jgi:hypothetical protein
VLLRVKDDKVTKVYEPQGMNNIFSLLVDPQGRVLLGTGGEKGQVLRIDNPGQKEPKVEQVFSENEVQYVWAIRQTPDGNLYIATGPNGQVFEVKPDGAKSVLLDSDENNVMSLVSDGKDTLYAGTDPNGLVYRINRKTREVFVVFDAPESEVSALALDAKGNLYAGTGEASEKAAPVPGTPASTRVPRTRPAAPKAPAACRSRRSRRENPKPPAVPDPNPGEPNPIPKGVLMVGGWEKLLKLQDEPGDDPGNPTPPPVPAPNPAPASTPPRQARPRQRRQPAAACKSRPRADRLRQAQGRGQRDLPHRHRRLRARDLPPAGHGHEPDRAQRRAPGRHGQRRAHLPGRPRRRGDDRPRQGRSETGPEHVGDEGWPHPARHGQRRRHRVDVKRLRRLRHVHQPRARRHPDQPLWQDSPPGIDAQGTSFTLATRSGNVQDPEKTGWSGWSEEAPAATFVQVKSPPARFLQYRLTFTSTAGKESAVVDEVDLAYQMPNLARSSNRSRSGTATAAAKLATMLGACRRSRRQRQPKPPAPETPSRRSPGRPRTPTPTPSSTASTSAPAARPPGSC